MGAEAAAAGLPPVEREGDVDVCVFCEPHELDAAEAAALLGAAATNASKLARRRLEQLALQRAAAACEADPLVGGVEFLMAART